MKGTTGLVLRPATAADMTDVHAVVMKSGLRSARDPAALEFYRTGPGGQLIVACQDDRVTGVSCAFSFGRTGWIGNVGVDPDARGRGLGTAVSAAALDALRAAGAQTVLLTATDLGRPVYERLGFGYDGMHYGIWRRDPGSEPVPVVTGGVRAGTPEAARAQDLQATGEDRGAFLDSFAGRIRVPDDGAGYRLWLPWRGGPVVATTETAARALLTDLVRSDDPQSLSFPESNEAGAKLAADLGFQQVRRIPRMRIGPPVDGFRPERIFNVFSFAVG
jgi:GNAT superfamily N-acetyltransferase